MKKLVLIGLASLPALVFAQDGKYAVKGTLATTYNAPAKIYLEYRLKGKATTDSVTLTNGKFEFDGITGAAPINAYLVLNKSRGQMIARAHTLRKEWALIFYD